jgi:hypothetical protein
MPPAPADRAAATAGGKPAPAAPTPPAGQDATKTASAADPTKPPSDPDFCAAYFQKLRQTRH